jgi:hypothetical protein
MFLLLTCTAATLFMLGLAVFVQVVHYPLFAAVGADRFAAYHEAHSRLTTYVVFPPMAIELVTSWLLVLDPPADETALAVAGALLATATWALTALAAVPAHRDLGKGPAGEVLARLMRANLLRCLAWAGHAGVCLALLAAAS